MAKRQTRYRKQKRSRRRTMKGGAFSQQELQQLQNSGFSEYQIESLKDLGVSFNEVIQKINTIMNQVANGFHGNSDNMAEQVMIELLNEHNFGNQNTELDAIPHAVDDEHNLDNSFDSQGTMNLDELNASQETMNLDELNSSQGTMNLDELNSSNMSGYTTEADESFGGKRRRRMSKKKHGKKSRKTRKQRGGACYGNGVGANSYDPNYSIYNTNMLKLFPYRSTI